MIYPLVVYTKNGEWKTVKSEEEEQEFRPEYRRWLEWKQPETVSNTVKIQVDTVITPETPIQIQRKPGRPSKSR